jgi:CheY-like chemotaxis protein
MNKLYSFILIDDDPSCNEITEIQIKRLFANANIVSFNDPKEAILSIENDYLTYPEETIILLDINMPYSGWKVLEGFEGYPQEVHKRFTIYILSSSSDERDAERARLFPLVKACIEKPLTKETLLNIVENSN